MNVSRLEDRHRKDHHHQLYGFTKVWLSLPFNTKLILFTSIFKPALNIYTVPIWNNGKILLLPSYLGVILGASKGN